MSQEDSVLHPSEVAERIRYFRKKAGLKGFQLAGACAVSPSTVSHWENGTSDPTHENLARVARACGVDLGEFWSTQVELELAPVDEG